MTIRFYALILVALAAAFSPIDAARDAPAARAQTAPAQPATDRAKVEQIVGTAQRRVVKNPEQWAKLSNGDLLAPDSAVQSGPDSAVLLTLADKHVVRVGESTTLELKVLGKDNAYSFSLVKGQIWSFVDKANKPAKYEVETPSTILGVSGTLFHVAHDPSDNESDVSVEEGEVHMRQGRVDKAVGDGNQIRVLPNRLRGALVRPHTKATAEMWKTLHSKESWQTPNRTFALHKDVDAGARAMHQERLKEKGAGRGGRGRGGRRGG